MRKTDSSIGHPAAPRVRGLRRGVRYRDGARFKTCPAERLLTALVAVVSTGATSERSGRCAPGNRLLHRTVERIGVGWESNSEAHMTRATQLAGLYMAARR